MRIKKILSFLVAVAMVISMLPSTAFAANNTATTMRLAKTEGTVTVTNATDKVVKQTENMKLYNGYQLKTGAESYAWISLDDTKAAKLDANSVVSVQKSGKKLTLYLSSGNLFFNVKETLKSDESFNIKTSTMTMGVRGTSGCVRVINPRVSEVHLMTGKVEVKVEHPELNIEKTAILTAGTTATSMIDAEAVAVSGELVEIVIEKLEEETVCGNCAVEIEADPVLQERIEAETDLDVEEIVESAEEKLEADEKAAEEKQEIIEETIENQELPEVVDPYFEQVETEDSTDNTPSGGNDDDEEVPEAPPAETNVVSSWGELVEKIKAFNEGNEDAEIVLGKNLPTAEDMEGTLEALPEIEDANGKTLTLNLSEYILGLDEPLVNNGNLVITNIEGAIGPHSNASVNNAAIENNGNLTLLDGTIVVSRTGIGVNNNLGATFTMLGGAFDGGEIVIDANGEMTFTEGFGNEADETLGVNNYQSADVEISGGTFDTCWSIVSVGDTAISGGTFNVAEDYCNAIEVDGGMLSMTGGTINVSGESSVGVTINLNSVMEMNGGTINVAANNSCGIDIQGSATLSKGNIKVNANLTGVPAGISTSGDLVMNGIKVKAYSGIAVENTGNAELSSPTSIYAYGTANAVFTDGGTVVRPVTANISAEKYTSADSTDTNGVFYPLLEDMVIEPGATNPDTGAQMNDLVDNYGKVNNPLTFAEKVQLFNDGTDDYTITLEADVDMTTVTEALPSAGTSSADGKTLTIDLNGKTLTLAETWFNLGNLVITDNASGGQIIGDVENRLIANSGNITWDGGTLLVSTEATSGIESTGKVTLAGGHIKASDASLLNGNMSAIKIISGTFEMTGGILEAEVTRTDFPSGYTYYNVVALNNQSTATLYGGEIIASTGRTMGVSNLGTLNVDGVEIDAVGQNSYGVVNSGTANIESGTIRATGVIAVAFSMSASGTAVNFNGGLITADDTSATAYGATTNTNYSSVVNTTIRALNPNYVWNGTAAVPAGYEVSAEAAGDGYYYLQEAGAADTTAYASDWETFVDAVSDYNSSDEIDTIALTANINPTEDEALAFALPNINNVYGNTLTLDLGTSQLALPVILNADTPLTIEGTSGSITADDQLLAGATLISGDEIALFGGAIGVPAGYTGIYANNFTMTDGSVTASGGTGIITATEANLEGGAINADNGGLGVEITAGTVTLDGATIYVNDGEGVDNTAGIFTMNSGEIEVDGGTGITAKWAEFLGGTITVNSTIGNEKGIYVDGGGTIDIAGTDIYVNGSTDPEYYNYGVYVVNNSGMISVSGSEIIAEAGAYQAGEGNAHAIYGTGTGAWTGFSFDNSATVRASSSSNVIFPACDGYEIVEDTDGTFYLKVEGTSTQSAWARFVDSVYAFNEGDSDQTIRLTENVIPTAADIEAYELPTSIGNGLDSVLTIDLDTYTLELPMTLNTDTNVGGSPIVIKGSTGEIKPSNLLETEGGNETAMITAGAPLTLQGGTISVPENYIGIEAYEFELAGGTVVADGGIGIVCSSTVRLTNGYLIVGGGIGVDNGGGVISLDGANVTVEAGTGVTLFQGFFTMNDGTMLVENGSVGISNSSTVDLYGGTINVYDGGTGIYNAMNGTTNMVGTEMYVYGGADIDTAAYGIYDRGGRVYISAGQIVAESTEFDENHNGNAYALFCELENWAELVYEGTGTVRASSAANVYTPDSNEYEAVEDTDGTYYLMILGDGGGGE